MESEVGVTLGMGTEVYTAEGAGVQESGVARRVEVGGIQATSVDGAGGSGAIARSVRLSHIAPNTISPPIRASKNPINRVCQCLSESMFSPLSALPTVRNGLPFHPSLTSAPDQ